MSSPSFRSVRSIHNSELMTGMGCYAAGIRDKAGYVALCWIESRPDMLTAYGPFRNQTEARKFGRKNYPRRYKVAGLHDPATVDFYYKG